MAVTINIILMESYYLGVREIAYRSFYMKGILEGHGRDNKHENSVWNFDTKVVLITGQSPAIGKYTTASLS